jgi:fermentation-respiration switch protein FrsA (DUF1100 family)
VPTLIIQGDDDQIVPFASAGLLQSKLIKGADLKVYKGAPHGLCTTLKDQVNADLLAFVERKEARRTPRLARRHGRRGCCGFASHKISAHDVGVGSWLRKNVSERSKATSDWLASTLRRADWLFL